MEFLLYIIVGSISWPLEIIFQLLLQPLILPIVAFLGHYNSSHFTLFTLPCCSISFEQLWSSPTRPLLDLSTLNSVAIYFIPIPQEVFQGLLYFLTSHSTVILAFFPHGNIFPQFEPHTRMPNSLIDILCMNILSLP